MVTRSPWFTGRWTDTSTVIMWPRYQISGIMKSAALQTSITKAKQRSTMRWLSYQIPPRSVTYVPTNNIFNSAFTRVETPFMTYLSCTSLSSTQQLVLVTNPAKTNYQVFLIIKLCWRSKKYFDIFQIFEIRDFIFYWQEGKNWPAICNHIKIVVWWLTCFIISLKIIFSHWMS